jgi:serine/threonine-protein phosphatase 6 regulatory subunit 3
MNPFQFARYLAQEMQSSEQFGSSSSDASDDEDEDGGWLAHSTFDLGNPPVYTRRHSSDRRPLGSSEFDVSVNVRSSFDML